MSVEQYKKIMDLIESFGSSQFLKGTYIDNPKFDFLYAFRCKRSESLLKEIRSELEKL